MEKFLEVYRFLPSEGKAHFESQLAGELKDKDAATKKLYYCLLQAAKDGKNIKEAISLMSGL
ncbi:MAG: hypothetical protein KJ811_02705 [Candidatus Margulisbacteria bacterium]|nr:hypothetical protein [Candidatus Margulisiibacteriota bacterium]